MEKSLTLNYIKADRIEDLPSSAYCRGAEGYRVGIRQILGFPRGCSGAFA